MSTGQYCSWFRGYPMFKSIMLAYQKCLLCLQQCQHIVLVPSYECHLQQQPFNILEGHM